MYFSIFSPPIFYVLICRPHTDSVGAMAFTAKQMSLIVATFGALSFIFGVVAENKKVTIVYSEQRLILNFFY